MTSRRADLWRLVRGPARGSLTLVLSACSGTLDAGSDGREPALPVGPDNPVILSNDGPFDNWHGEYAVLLAHGGRPVLCGIIVGTGGQWADLESNLGGWRELATRARASGLVSVPDPIPSASAPLTRPDDGNIDSTLPNDSAGARFILETSSRLATPERPVVVATGGRLTDVADAYLLDPAVVDRVVVVASLGTGFSDDERAARMGIPNGEMDPWANAIVAQRFRYVQVSAFYDQLADVPGERVSELPENPLGEWMRAKQPDLLTTPLASDQVSVLAVAMPSFVMAVTRVSFSGWEDNEPTLAPDTQGNVWLVTRSDGDAAGARLRELLLDPQTFGG